MERIIATVISRRFTIVELCSGIMDKVCCGCRKKKIGMKTVWKGNKPWWSDSSQKEKEVHRLKREFRRNRNGHTYKTYKQAANELKRRLQQEKQEYLVKSIQSLQEGNTRQLFSQFKSMNNNKINSEKVELLVSWFAQSPKPPDHSKKWMDIMNM
ncbi:integrase [Reticulomyxa filosa]|uniref:Integrase n=1 Tax=Reticulomyxa filosa TaxID=46433 RepID=X6LNP9_RETFI|nr:integrase [Reticulomyxa filosa]|eukprot:ETO02340.1 integrase [Reticulomyxa filosa]